MKIKIGLCFLLLLICSFSFGQIEQYNYKRELTGIKEQWHKIILPREIFKKISPDLSDIRIFGLSGARDSIEAPYILQFLNEKINEKEATFTLINQAKNEKGYYFTFELNAENAVNEIRLQFKQQNFDWRVTAEGSQNQQDWFSITSDYRILSIKNELTDFKFTKISFPDSKYRYYRLLINSKENPGLVTAKILLNEIIEGKFSNYSTSALSIYEEKQNRQTIVDVDLKSPVPVSHLQIFLKDRYDFYRPVTIQYLSDSIKTEQGWKYSYSDLSSGILNSMEKNAFTFNSAVLQKLKIIIENQDNQPLHIDSVTVKGYVHELIARFTQPATYYLVYGNNQATKPSYDIGRFTDKIPKTLTSLTLGDEQLIEKRAVIHTEPLFRNKAWLWGIIVVIIILLGWFSMNMMRKK